MRTESLPVPRLAGYYALTDRPAMHALVPSAATHRVHRDASALRSAGAHTIAFAEIPTAHHAFDMIAPLRCQFAADAVASFLGIRCGRRTQALRDRRGLAALPAG